MTDRVGQTGRGHDHADGALRIAARTRLSPSEQGAAAQAQQQQDRKEFGWHETPKGGQGAQAPGEEVLSLVLGQRPR